MHGLFQGSFLVRGGLARETAEGDPKQGLGAMGWILVWRA